ncbi:DNA mismatch repair protein MutL [Clostridia bacterium]|nr:DNA mismatch repair protein MutL [Clostridia bacterium]
MNRIRPLDSAVVNLIAAGEVVERPALAIKELIENSFDAQARAVTVELRDGGLSYFRVTDNGVGIPREELALAFARSATSKLRAAEDLADIATMGFRGEALASIAAVSKVTLTSRPRGVEDGAAIDIEGGRILKIRDAASPEGTTVVVKDLFFNVPARRKFLKKPLVETAYATDWIIKLAAAWPDVCVRIINQSRQTFRSAGDGNARGVLAAAWGLETAQRLIPVSGAAAGCVVEGFIGVGEEARHGKAQQWLFLNRRVVRANVLADAVESACRERVMIGRSPIFALWLTTDYAMVDVNVHPNKLEVRFRDECAVCEGISGLVNGAVRNAAPSHSTVVSMPPQASNPFADLPAIDLNSTISTIPDNDINASIPSTPSIPSIPNIPTITIQPQQPPEVETSNATLISAARDTAVPMIQPEAEQQTMRDIHGTPETAPTFRVFGAAFNQYILAELDETLYVIDQHAAHERFLYDQFIGALDGETASQPMLAPLTLTLTRRESALVDASRQAIADAGFIVEPFGDCALRVTAVPMVLGEPAPDLIRAVIDALGDFCELPTMKRQRDTLIKLACKKAIKGGEPLTRAQISGLISQLARTNTAPTCPHGRPICVAIEKRELDRRFKRIV